MSDVKEIKVLLIDDEEELIEYLSKRLLRGGFTVRAASSGEEGVSIAVAEDFDVAVVDLKMPRMDGVETQHQLREVRPFLQCIVVTGHASFDTALESGKENAFAYLQKPVEHDVLVKLIQSAAEKKRELQQSKFLEELQDVISSQGSPRAIKQGIDELRRRLGMD